MNARELALACLVDHTKIPRLIDLVQVRCDSCKNVYIKNFKYIIKCCGNSGRLYWCRPCSNKEILSRPGRKKTNSNSNGKISELWKSAEYRNKICLASKNVSLEERNRRSKTMKEAWSNEEFRKDHVKMAKETHITPIFTDTIRKKLSNQMKDRWEDPVMRNKYLIGREKASQKALETKVSSLNQKVFQILSELGVDYQSEYKLGPYSFDVFLSSQKILIEIQGEYWHALPKNALRDRQKATFISRYYPDLRLKYVMEIEFSNMEALRSKICSVIDHKIDLLDFNFRDIEIKKIDFTIANNFLEIWHYLHGARPGLSFGAYLSGELIAVCNFSRLRNYKQESIELSRFCIHPRRHKRNFASYVITRCVKMLPIEFKEVIAFADLTHDHNGCIYKAMNWELIANIKPDYWYITEDGWVYHKRTIYERAIKMGLKESEYVQKHNLTKCHGKEKLKYSWRSHVDTRK